MKSGQFVFYLTRDPFYAYWFLHIDDVCNLPGTGYFKVRKSPYILMLES